MIIEVHEIRKGPEFISEKVTKMLKVLKYLTETQDGTFITNSRIKKMEIYKSVFIKVFIDDEIWTIDTNCIEWLKTHHYMSHAIAYKDQLEKLWDIICDEIDMFIVEDWYVDTHLHYKKKPEVTYDRDRIYVKGKDTHIPFTADNYEFVAAHKERWY